MVLEFHEASTFELCDQELEQPSAPGPGGREGEVGEPSPDFPSVFEARTLQDWLALSPGRLYGLHHLAPLQVLHVATQALKAFNPDGHLASPSQPEGVLRAHLCARMRRLFDPDLLFG